MNHPEIVHAAAAAREISVLETVYDAFCYDEIHPSRKRLWRAYLNFKLYDTCPLFLENYCLDVLSHRAERLDVKAKPLR